MATAATQVVLDTPAPVFQLPATDGKTYALDDVAGEKGTVVVFICNHCPYVKAVIDRMVSDARVLMSEGVGFTADLLERCGELSRRLICEYEAFREGS